MARSIIGKLFIFLALAPLVALAACGGDDDDSGGSCDAALVPGIWLSDGYSVRFADDLSYEAAGAPNLMTIDVTGQAAIDGCEISFTDLAGDYACPEDQVGVYSFAVTEAELHLELVEDPCDGRRIPLDGATLTGQ